MYTAISAIGLTVTQGLLGLIVLKLVISRFGSDFNGLNSTATQLVSMLLIVEGGFTLVANVALFKPLANNNYDEINAIMAATKKTFYKIGIIFLVLGVAISIGYTFVINSGLPKSIIVSVLLMTVISTFFDLFYAAKYTVLLKSEQREYILNAIRISTFILSEVLIIVMILGNGHMVLVRFFTMLGSIINGLAVGYACRKQYPKLNLKKTPNFAAIKGTRDMFMQKMFSMIHGIFPIVFIAATAGGTVLVSVYAVYNSIFSILRAVLYAFSDAPRMGFGQLIAQEKKEYVFEVFLEYQFIVIFVLFILFCTAAALIMPFIQLYLKGVHDANYQNWYIAGFFILTVFFELIRMPSGNIINMSGNFKTGKNFQMIAAGILIVLMPIGNYFWSYYGILATVLLISIVLAVLEIGFVYRKYFNKKTSRFFRMILPNLMLYIFLGFIELLVFKQISSVIAFVLSGFILLIINSFLGLLLNYFVNRNLTVSIVRRVKALLIK